ncbi:hypothetical protein H4R27_000613 [Coemansia aciculifera]|nr:hypothetical protein H4R27_000613 [Coemansia aciculifera]
MSETDDFNYDSVVSDPGVYTGILDATTTIDPSLQAQQQENNLLTPVANNRAQTPPPRDYGINDSTPSLAVSTPSSEKFHIEFEHERMNNPEFGNNSTQSQFGLKSGMYHNRPATDAAESTTDFSAKLRGDVVVSGAWGTIRASTSQNGAQEQSPLHISDGSDELEQLSAINEDTTFDIQSFDDSTDVTLSRLIHESSLDDVNRQVTLEQQYGRAHRSATISHSTDRRSPRPEMEERRQSSHTPSVMVTPKLTRTRSDPDVSPDQRILRSALRGSRTSPMTDDQRQDDPAPTTPRKVSFAVAQASASGGSGSDSTASLAHYASTSGKETQEDESIEFRSQSQLLVSQTEGPWGVPTNLPDEVIVTEASALPQEPEASPVLAQPTRRNVSLTSGGIGGVGMPGDMFRKFAGWAQSSLSPRSPSTSPATLPAATTFAPLSPAAINGDGKESPTKDATLGSLGSSQSNSSLSPVKTEPMRSQLLSNFTTPTSSKTNVGSPLTTPTRSPLTTPTQPMPRRNSQTPSRSVNPLTRHLARKAILSAPPTQRSPLDRSGQSQNTTPSRGGQPSSDDLSSISGLLDISGIQREFDGFASKLQHDASAVRLDILESEEEWQRMEQELQQLRSQNVNLETARDFYQRQVEETEKERLEWEQERQQLVDDKHELMGNIDLWRQRIGDAESERQGAWNEGTQTRSELLHAIARLEDEVADSRVAHAQLVRRHAQLEDELNREREESRCVHQELLGHIDEAQAESNRVDAENRQMQAELHEAQSRCVELEHDAQSIEAMRRKVVALETERAAFAAKHAGAVEHVNRLEQQLADAERKARTEATRFRDDQNDLKDTLETLTERNHELKQQLKQQQNRNDEESNFFVTAINDAGSMPDLPLPPKQPAVAVETATTQTDEPEGVVVLRREQVEELDKWKNDYDTVLESLQTLQASKERHKSENKELAAMAESARQEIKSLRQQVASSDGHSGDAEQELRDAEAIMRELHERNSVLTAKNDELVQRTARLETEISDLQMRGGDSAEVSLLHTTLEDMEAEVQRSHRDIDRLQQLLATKEAELDDVQGALSRAQQDLAIAKKAMGEANGKISNSPNGSANTSPTLDRPSLVLERTELELAEIEANIAKNLKRRDMALKEQRYVAEVLRDLFVGNTKLRGELSAIYMRRGGKLREMKSSSSRAASDLGALSDDGNMSIISNATISNVPSTSQLIDGSGAKYLDYIDQHYEEVANLIDSSAQPINGTPLRHANSAQVSSRLRKVLTPIKEEFAVTPESGPPMQDVGTQCDIDGQLEAARAQVFGLEDECRVQRLAVASAKQERDQFKVAQEEATERIAQLSAQMEDLGEDQERMRADNATTARIALRVTRQMAVLNSALSRLAPRDALPSGDSHDDGDDDALAVAEDGAMMKAIIDRPLDDEDASVGVINDEALEQLGFAVSEAYAQAKRVRRDVERAKRERARLMKRLAEEERSKLPSYELSAQWGLKVRSPMRPAQAVGRLLDDMDDEGPPPSLFLPDESAVMAEVAATRKQMAADNADDSRLMVSMAALRDPMTAAAEVSRLAVHVRRMDRQLKNVCADRDKLEEFNRELVQKLDRANSERVRAQQECNALSLRNSATVSRAAAGRSAATTPTRGTDWDDFESIKKELDRCSRKNKSYFENVGRLCRVLNQHTIDRTLADEGGIEPAGSPADASADAGNGTQNQPENVYRTLLLDMADVLDARADLDERMSIRGNFSNLAAAVRRRLNDKEAQLKLLRAELNSSRQATSETEGATDEALRRAKRNVSEFETQLTEAHEQLTTQQANVRSLNDNISRLRQQCVAADSDLQEARLERDGWHQQYLACEQTLNYQIEENDRLSDALKRQGQQLRSRTTEEFVITRQSYGDQPASLDWDRLRAEWSAAVRQEDAEIWRNKEFLLRQACGSQLDMYRWALRVWADITRGIVVHSARDNTDDSARAEKSKALQHAVGELESEVEAAVRKAHTLHESLQTTPSGGKTNRANFVESLSQIAQDLSRDFAGSWRDNMRSCIVAMASCVSAGTLHTPGNGQLGDSPTTSTSSGGSATFPRISDEQKSMIREHYGRREDKLKRELRAQLQAESAESKAREDAVRTEFMREKSVLVAESKYLRAKIQIEADRHKSVGYQNTVLMQLFGGHDGLMRIIDQLVVRKDPNQTVVHSRCRQMCRRVLFAVRLKNRLTEILAQKRDADAIKDRALRSRDQRSSTKQQSTAVASSRGQPPVSKRSYEPQPQYAQHHQSQQIIGFRSTPITPSRLRNRSSELRSSSGSSYTQ